MKTFSKSPIYIDNQSTTPVDKRVIEAMLPYFAEQYGNPHSNDHWFGWQSRKALENARSSVANFIGADTDEIIFTSGATEANNMAILGILKFLKDSGKTKIVSSAFEHKCVLECLKAAEQQGFEVKIVQPDSDGFITANILEASLDHRVGLVSIMMVNNEIGTIQPINELANLAHSVGALFHTDAAQSGFSAIDLTDKKIEMLSLSSHKIYGPKGIGALFIKREVQKILLPIILGGGQENGFRSGTIPTMLCVGFGKACEIMQLERTSNTKHLTQLSTLFWRLLSGQYPEALINGSIQDRHPGNLNILFPKIDAHSLLQSLQPNVAASTGSACSSGTLEPSHVLRAIGLSDDLAESSIRFSFGLQNTEADIEHAVEHIITAIINLQSNSE